MYVLMCYILSERRVFWVLQFLEPVYVALSSAVHYNNIKCFIYYYNIGTHVRTRMSIYARWYPYHGINRYTSILNIIYSITNVGARDYPTDINSPIYDIKSYIIYYHAIIRYNWWCVQVAKYYNIIGTRCDEYLNKSIKIKKNKTTIKIAILL